jgi:hypothetical protein
MTEEEQDQSETPASAETGDEAGEGEESGPSVDQLDEDPAYNPDDENLKDIKGG